MILIIDFGSQYTQLVARRVRELGVYSEIVSFRSAPEKFKLLQKNGGVSGVILSGGPHSVYEVNAPTLPKDILLAGVPTLGICYGLQLINKLFDGKVTSAKVREYGFETFTLVGEVEKINPLAGLATKGSHNVWMSHGDHISQLSSDFICDAKTSNGSVAAVHHKSLPIFGLQFHPEVEHSECGRDILKHFIFETCGARTDWTMKSVSESLIAEIKEQADSLGKDSNVICALSGGVDSAVAAVLTQKAIGNRLHCLFIDTGLLRKGEYEQVLAWLVELKLNVKGVNASEIFLSRLAGVSDPEQKRKIIGHTFIEVFEAEAKKIENARFLVQGTLYTDVIESVPVHGTSVVIKSHHNVGGLPEKMALKLIEPLRGLFKDEVRKLGAEMGVPQRILQRHPFPGPGLAIRIISDVTPQKLEILREADAIFVDELKKEGLYDKVWQAFAVLLPVQSVGVMGDGRTYEFVCALRSVDASDGMTAAWSQLPPAFLMKVSSRITNEVRGINRVVFDITSKPPATIEWE